MEIVSGNGRDAEDGRLDEFIVWLEGHGRVSRAKRALEEATGVRIKERNLYRIKELRRWDRGGKIRDAWLAHPDSGEAEPPPARGDAEDAPALSGEAAAGGKSCDNGADPDEVSGGDGLVGSQSEGDPRESGDADDAGELLPEGMDLEDMVDVIDARRAGGSGGGGESGPDDGEPEDADWSRQRVLQAGTIEEIAAAVNAPVLREVPGLDLEDARACALLKLGGWTPTDRERRPPGLHGDAPILLHLGEDASYADEGARRLAFAPASAWADEGPYCAQQMRYGVTMDARQRRYLVDSHEGRPEFIGVRKADWAPELPYIDGDNFFGSGGFQRADGSWMPSRAEALAYLYHVRGIESAFRGTAADSASSPYLLTVRKVRMELEYLLLGDEYRMSFHHHGMGRSVPDSARFAERRGLESQIADLETRMRSARRQLVLRRALGPALMAPVTTAQRLYRRLVDEDPEGECVVTGESEWQALDPPWERRERTRWYEAGTGPLSPEAAGEGGALPAPGAPFAAAGPEECLLRVRPPRTGEFSISGFQGVLDSLGEGHVLSLEILGTHSETALMVRTVHPDRVVAALALRYPGVEFQRVMPADDPLRLREGETAWRRVLRPEGPEFLPFSVNDDLNAPPTADRFLSIVGAMRQDLHGDERLLSRVVLRQKAHDWSERWKARALAGPGSENAQAAERERRQARGSDAGTRGGGASSGSEDSVSLGDPLFLALIAFMGLAVLSALGVWLDSVVDSVGLFRIIAYAAAGLVVTGLVGFLAWRVGAAGAVVRFFKPPAEDYNDHDQVRLRVSGGAHEFEVHTMAVLGERAEAVRAGSLLAALVNAYRSFDSPLGARFAVEDMRLLVDAAGYGKLRWRERRRADIQLPDLLCFAADSRGCGPLSRRPKNGIVGSLEAASFWHLPGGSVEVASLRRVQSRRLGPPDSALRGGALVGVAHESDGGRTPVHFPDETKGRHRFLVARTSMGKSTLIGHCAGEEMAAMARWESDDALVVIDPHADLVRDLLRCVPEEIAHRVALVDLDDPDRTVGINVLDTVVFDDREAAVQAIVEVVRGADEAWGNRIASILTHVMKSLYEANRDLPRHKQLTLLEGSLMLSDPNFRDAVLDRVQDPTVVDWWRSSHGGWSQEYGKDAIAPVMTRLSKYSGSRIARAIFGQRRCTLNLRSVVKNGGVLLVNINQSSLGSDVSALVGVSILKLLDVIITEQGQIENADERRRVSLIVDEMHTLEGADFQKILSQIGKRGGVLTLATQSLASLSVLGDTMREDVLANTGVLVTFQVNAPDAERLLPELRSEHLDEADITGLPVHHCVVRLIGEGEVEAPFTMEVLPPLEGDRRIEAVIKEGTHSYTRSRSEVLTELDLAAEERVRHFRAQIRERLETRGRDERVDLEGRAGEERTRGGRRSKPKDAA